MRYFISIDVESEEVRESLVNFMQEIEGYGNTKTVKPENLHITLLYLGEREKEDVDEMKSIFTGTCEEIDVGEFTCNVENVGVFPHMNYIKVIWAGVKPREKLYKLHMNFSEGMNGVDEHDFMPHVTLGRVKGISGEEKEALKSKIERVSPDFGSFQAKNVRLKRSEPGEDGPEYTDLEVHRL